MLVGGCFGLLKVLSLLWRQVRLRRYRDTGDVDADVDAVYNDDDDDDDEGGGAIMSKSSRYTTLITQTSTDIPDYFTCTVLPPGVANRIIKADRVCTAAFHRALLCYGNSDPLSHLWICVCYVVRFFIFIAY